MVKRNKLTCCGVKFYSIKWCWMRNDDNSTILSLILQWWVEQIKEEKIFHFKGDCNSPGQELMKVWLGQWKIRLDKCDAESWFMHLWTILCLTLQEAQKRFHQASWERLDTTKTIVKEKLWNQESDPDPNLCLPLTQCQILDNLSPHLHLSFFVWPMRKLKPDGPLGFLKQFSSRRNQGSLEKYLILKLGQVK